MSGGNGEQMKCKCGGDLDAVVDSRPRLHKDFGQIVARRRKCSACGERCSTYEIHEDMVENIRRDIAKEMMAKVLEGFL